MCLGIKVQGCVIDIVISGGGACLHAVMYVAEYIWLMFVWCKHLVPSCDNRHQVGCANIPVCMLLLWQVLQLEEAPSTVADFFSLGGTSLAAMQVAASLQAYVMPALLLHRTRTISATSAALTMASSHGARHRNSSSSSCTSSSRCSGSEDLSSLNSFDPEQAGPIPQRHWPTQWRPAAPGMEQMWTLQQLDDPGSVVYNEPIAVHIPHKLSRRELECCLQILLARHEVLRCRVVTAADAQLATGAETVNSLVLSASIATHSADDSSSSGDSAGGGLGMNLVAEVVPLEEFVLPMDEWIECWHSQDLMPCLVQQARCSLDLESGPLIKVTVAQLLWDGAPAPWLVMLIMHHAICDGWAMNILVKELLSCCNQVASKQLLPPVLPPLSCSFFDWVAWQLEQRQGQHYKHAVSYWVQQLTASCQAGAASLKLPDEKPGSSQMRSCAGGAVVSHIPKELMPALRRLVQKFRTSMHNLLLAAFLALLARVGFNQATDSEGDGVALVVGVPVAGRDHPSSHSLVGNCINVVALCCNISTDSSFEQIVCQANDQMHEAMHYGFVALADVVQALSHEVATPQALQSQGSPFRVMFAGQNDGLQGCIQPDLGISKLDLTLSVLGTELHWEFRHCVLNAGSVERLACQYLHLLQGMAESTAAPLHSLCLLPPMQQQQILQRCTGASCPDYLQRPLVHEGVAARAALTPMDVALVCDTTRQVISYRQLELASRQLAGHLRAKGVGSSITDDKSKECTIWQCA